MAVAPVPLMLLRWRLDVMTPGDEEATSLGVRTVVIAAATLMTAAAVSVSGIVG